MFLSINKSYYIYLPSKQRFIADNTVNPSGVSFTDGTLSTSTNALIKFVKIKGSSDEFVRVGDIVNIILTSKSNLGDSSVMMATTWGGGGPIWGNYNGNVVIYSDTTYCDTESSFKKNILQNNLTDIPSSCVGVYHGGIDQNAKACALSPYYPYFIDESFYSYTEATTEYARTDHNHLHWTDIPPSSSSVSAPSQAYPPDAWVFVPESMCYCDGNSGSCQAVDQKSWPTGFLYTCDGNCVCTTNSGEQIFQDCDDCNSNKCFKFSYVCNNYNSVCGKTTDGTGIADEPTCQANCRSSTFGCVTGTNGSTTCQKSLNGKYNTNTCNNECQGATTSSNKKYYIIAGIVVVVIIVFLFLRKKFKV